MGPSSINTNAGLQPDANACRLMGSISRRALVPGWRLLGEALWALGVLLAVALPAHAQPPDGVTATFSIVACDPATGVCGAAVASKYPGVGKVVPYVRPGVGAFCTQHWHNPAFGERALDLLAAGKLPEEVLGELLRGDRHADKRQLGLVDIRGRAANRNPAEPDDDAQYCGAITGRGFAIQGNTLAGRAVLAEMARAYEETQGSLADRLVAALVAGDRAGGDHRGKLAAGVRVCKTDVPGYWLDLQVEQSADPVRDLLANYLANEHPARGGWRGDQGIVTASCSERFGCVRRTRAVCRPMRRQP